MHVTAAPAAADCLARIAVDDVGRQLGLDPNAVFSRTLAAISRALSGSSFSVCVLVDLVDTCTPARHGSPRYFRMRPSLDGRREPPRMKRVDDEPPSSSFLSVCTQI